MAKYLHTPELLSAKVKYPIYRQLTVQETVCNTASKTRGIGINYVLVKLEPCVVLRGKWLRLAGFPVGQKISIVVNQGELVITPKQTEPNLSAENKLRALLKSHKLSCGI